MTITAQTPDGTLHQFPDGTDPSVIDSAMKQYVAQGAPPQQAQPSNSTQNSPQNVPRETFQNGSQNSDNAPQQKPTSQPLGFYQGMMKPLDNLSTALDTAAKHLGLPTDALAHALGLPTTPEAVQAHQDFINRQSSQPGGVGRVAGEIMGTAPLAAVTENPLVLGAGSGALLSDEKTPSGVAEDAGIGAVAGKAGQVATSAIGNSLIKPIVQSPMVQKLIQEGVNLTPGQILGGMAKRLENAATSIPLVGDMIKGAQNRSTQTFNRAALNRALAPIGQTLPAGMPMGRDAVDHVYSAISNKYDSLLPNMTGVADPQLATDFNQIGQNAIGEGAKQDVLDRFNNVLDAQVKQRTQNGVFTGQALKDTQSNLGNIGRRLLSSQDADDRHLGSMVLDAQGSFNDMLERNNPGFGDELKATNNAYAQYARVRKAASYTGADDGVFTAPQFSRAVQASDKSAGKGAYARGKAMMQDLSDAGRSVLPSNVNDSGTPLRSLLGLAAAGELAHVSPTALAATGLGGLAYTRPIQKGIQTALTAQRPQALQAIGRGISAARIPATMGAAALGDQLMPSPTQ